MAQQHFVEEITNPTPYSPIPYSQKENNSPTQPYAFITPYFNTKLLKTLENLTTFKFP